MLAIMGLNEDEHVTWTGCSVYDFDKLADFEKVYGAEFDETQRQVYTTAQAAYDRYQTLKAAKAAAAQAAQPEAGAISEPVPQTAGWIEVSGPAGEPIWIR